MIRNFQSFALRLRVQSSPAVLSSISAHATKMDNVSRTESLHAHAFRMLTFVQRICRPSPFGHSTLRQLQFVTCCALLGSCCKIPLPASPATESFLFFILTLWKLRRSRRSLARPQWPASPPILRAITSSRSNARPSASQDRKHPRSRSMARPRPTRYSGAELLGFGGLDSVGNLARVNGFERCC